MLKKYFKINLLNYCSECKRVFQRKKWSNKKLKAEFESGVLLGLACFNLCASHTPKGILNIYQFVSRTGNRVSNTE